MRRITINVCSQAVSAVVLSDVRDCDGDSCWGVFDPVTLTIELWSGVPRSRRRGVLVHELAHAFEFILGRVHTAEGVWQEDVAQRIAAIDGCLTDALGSHAEPKLDWLFGASRPAGGRARVLALA